MALLMLFGKSLKNIPFDQVLPFNKDDLMVVMSREIAFRLTGIVDDENRPFSISFTMEKESVFHCSSFNDRRADFVDIMDARLERFFETKKTDYIFFDKEEQRKLKEIFEVCKLNCSVVIYVNSGDGFKEARLEELGFQQARKCIGFLNKLKVRVVLRPDEYHKLSKASSKRSEEAKKKFEEMSEEAKKKQMSVYFKTYKELHTFKSKSRVKKYYRNLSKKYHPDMGGSDKIFAQISEDFNAIFKSKWFHELPE